jgi:hypothetical protein
MRKGLGSLGTLLVLGLGMGLLRSGPPPGPVAPSGKSSATKQQRKAVDNLLLAAAKCGAPPCPEQDLVSSIDTFLLRPPASGPETDKSFIRLKQEFEKLAQSENQVSFAVAIVPDPVHTHLSLFFDRTIDAIQEGAQEAQWIFDRATMPWDSQEHPESTDFRIRLQQEDYQGDKEEFPGLMIFRPSDPERLNTSLFVFVVGETPTGGISKEQFRRAIELIGIVTKAKDPEAKNPLRIIGPTFSGSLYSLAQLISEAVPAKQFAGVVIRSGTVSSWNTARWFKKRCFDDHLHMDFATFQQSDRYMLRKFVEFEKGRGYAPDQIAVLAEDETAYGNREFPAPKDSPGLVAAPKQRLCPVGSHAQDPEETADIRSIQADEHAVLQLYFPRDISQLRSAYQQGFEQRASSSSDSYQVRSTLPLNLQDTGSDDDSVQQYAHSETPLSQESILLGIIAAIRERHIQYIVLQATNPMDTLFLSAFLKKGYSEARVVAAPADLLLSRDADDVSLLHGVMALTTYSLLPNIDEEVAVPSDLPSGRADHVFPNAYAAGTYNATLSQIWCFQPLPLPPGCVVTDSPADLPQAGYTEYGWPSLGGPRSSSNPLAPVVWLTVLGRGGFWPLAVLDSGEKAGNIESSPRPAHSDAPHEYYGKSMPKRHIFWRTFYGMVCGLVLVLVALYCLLLRKGSITASSSAMTLLAPVEDPCRPRLIAVIGWLLLVALLLLTWPWVAWLGPDWLPTVCVIAATLASLVLGITCVVELNRRKSTRTSRIFALVAIGLVLCFVVLYEVPGHSQNPFLYRYIHLSSGVSPLLPFLCLLAAGLWWAWFSLSGLALLDKRRPRLPDAADLDAPSPGHTVAGVTSSGMSETFADKLVNIARPCTTAPWVYWMVAALLMVTLFALDYGHPLLSLETRHFEWSYVIALGMLTFFLLGTLFRLLVIWLECRTLLTTIDHLPLRRAFAELNLTWEPFWRLGGAAWQDLYRLVSRQLETLEHLRREVKAREDAHGVNDLVNGINETAAVQDSIRGEFAQVRAAQTPDARRALLRSFVAAKRDPMSQTSSPSTPPQSPNEPDVSDYFIGQYARLQKQIAKTCAAALNYLQPKWWEDEGLITSELGSKGDEKNITVVCCEDKQDSTDPPLSTRLAERFVSLVYLNFILSLMLRMRTLTITVAGLYVFLLLSLNSYPFEPKTALRSGAILMLIFVVGMVGYVSAQVHRDSILSLVTQTKPGELGIEFWVRMGTFVALPLLSLMVSQFPVLNNALFSWLEPAVSALK